MTKKILLVDDSALMRRVLCDIINSDERFQVVARATNGLEAFDLLSRNQYDAVVLDVNMPKMNGLQLLEELRKFRIPARIMMASTDTMEGADTTIRALELGALDFVHKPTVQWTAGWWSLRPISCVRWILWRTAQCRFLKRKAR